MTGRRVKLAIILAGIVSAGLGLLAWTQPWFVVSLAEGGPLTVAGQAAAPGLSALALASLALAAALSIAGWVLRIILGVVQVGIGVLIAASAISALASPVATSSAAITDATAVSGPKAIADLVSAVATGAWPWVAVLAGAIGLVVGLAVLVTSSRWPGPTRKYETVASDGPSAELGTAGAWDALSKGTDPTGPSQ